MEESCCLVHYLFLAIGETQFVKGFETLLTGRKMKDLAQIHEAITAECLADVMSVENGNATWKETFSIKVPILYQ